MSNFFKQEVLWTSGDFDTFVEMLRDGPFDEILSPLRFVDIHTRFHNRGRFLEIQPLVGLELVVYIGLILGCIAIPIFLAVEVAVVFAAIFAVPCLLAAGVLGLKVAALRQKIRIVFDRDARTWSGEARDRSGWVSVWKVPHDECLLCAANSISQDIGQARPLQQQAILLAHRGMVCLLASGEPRTIRPQTDMLALFQLRVHECRSRIYWRRA